MIKKDDSKPLEQYIKYGNEYYASNLIYIKKSGEINMINLVTGEIKTVGSHAKNEKTADSSAELPASNETQTENETI